MRISHLPFCALLLLQCVAGLAGELQREPDLSQYNSACGIQITTTKSHIDVSWSLERHGTQAKFRFDLNTQRPLIQSISLRSSRDADRVMATGMDAFVSLRVGDRDLEKRAGWTIFFDRMQRKPHEVFQAKLDRANVKVESRARRAMVTIGDVIAGPFRGQLRWTFFADSPLILQEAILTTDRPRTAYLYDTGLLCRQTIPSQMVWTNSSGRQFSISSPELPGAQNLAVKGRAIAADIQCGGLAIFPPPHRYFYPLDFSNNYRNIWVGTDYQSEPLPFGFGIRHDPKGDDRYVPWFNAPPGSTQNMGLFLLLSPVSATDALKQAGRLTRDDHFEPLPGHTIFSSHYHVEHTRDMLEAQKKNPADDDTIGKLPSGNEYRIPQSLKSPGFVRTLKNHGVDIVHLAEFHYGNTPKRTLEQRVEQLQMLHAECARLSDRHFLLLPGEEPNVHLGGHWISFFPKPVYWVLNRPEDAPFVTKDTALGKIYQVGNKADMLRLLRTEEGLAWTAHPRIKSSTGFPDQYRNELFYQSDRFLGAAWKAMPADLSEPRLGSRVLNLLDDMSNWGEPKYIVGEVDVFKVEPDHELYAHMNVNYLRLNKAPRFNDGWGQILDALRGGKFFVSTGEVLIPEFMVNGKRSGELATRHEDGHVKIQLDLQWTFPLEYAEIISGNGRDVQRQRIDLSMTEAYDKETFLFDLPVENARWIRIEVWDIATNGAFTQPVWINRQ